MQEIHLAMSAKHYYHKETDIFFRENSRKKLHRGAISELGWDGLEVAQDLHLSGVMFYP